MVIVAYPAICELALTYRNAERRNVNKFTSIFTFSFYKIMITLFDGRIPSVIGLFIYMPKGAFEFV